MCQFLRKEVRASDCAGSFGSPRRQHRTYTLRLWLTKRQGVVGAVTELSIDAQTTRR